MVERKQTPDILGEILGNMTTADPFIENQPRAPRKSAGGKGEMEKATVRTVTKKQAQPASKAGVDKKAKASLRWEYQVISFQEHGKGWKARYRNGVEIDDWMAGPSLTDLLNQMGTEGWELAAASAGERLYGSADRHQVYFKRLK